MATALVVDDSKMDQRLAGTLLEQRADLHVRYADDGCEAIGIIAEQKPDLVLTDMRMPGLDGLELVQAVRKSHPSIPVILMTSHGSEELAAEALRKGAASYVPKKFLTRDLLTTVERVLEVVGLEREQHRAIDCLTLIESHFDLDNDTSRIHPLIRYLRQDIIHLQLFDDTDVMRVGVALDEALANAMVHGNLAVDPEVRQSDPKAYLALLQERRQEPPYADRRVRLSARLTRHEATFVIADEGDGFDPSLLPDPRDPENIEQTTGRGLLLIRSFMTEVQHNARGNQITMIKRSEKSPVAAEAAAGC